VECLSSRNCTFDLACDAATGQCVNCTSDADCSQERPYCTAEGCVECRSNTNCAAQGVQCVSNVCGSCGDGICSKRERLLAVDFGSTDVLPYEVCREDCQDQCLSGTAKLNEVVRVELGTKGLFETGCTNQGTADAAVEFTAKEGGTYYAKVERVAGEEGTFVLASGSGACPGESRDNCHFSDGSTLTLEFDAEADQTTTLVLDSYAPGTFELSIGTEAPPCQGPFCGPGGPGGPGGDAGRPNDQGKTVCLENARDRGEEMCEGVTCACSHCPRDYDDCAIIPGCTQVSECLRTRGCVGQDCFDTGACSSVINSYGGASGPAFRAANALQSCDLAFSCNLPCGDAGTGSSPDAGARVCTPGKARTCACADGGSADGDQTCNEDGSAYSECKCHARAPKDANSSCECGFSRAGSSGPGVAAMLGLATAFFARRRRQRTRPAR
jgi:MYXO-CTERM domain-containing protein